jgi:hypothetical protein
VEAELSARKTFMLRRFASSTIKANSSTFGIEFSIELIKSALLKVAEDGESDFDEFGCGSTAQTFCGYSDEREEDTIVDTIAIRRVFFTKFGERAIFLILSYVFSIGESIPRRI